MFASPRALAVVSTIGLAAACADGGAGFDLARARAHVDHLAGRIGSRPIGTPANSAARLYIVSELRQLGFDVRIQDAEVRRGHIHARVHNIIAFRAGDVPDAIALVSHYDSVPQAAGALDDAWAVAATLEAAHALAGRLRHSLFVIVTDGEEMGLLGARAVVDDSEVAQRVKAFLNFDGTGAAGPVVLFETTRGGGPALAAWARAAPEPRGGSFAIEIYKRLPNDTDFTVLSQLDASGLNFAPVIDSYAYHTDRDVPARVRDATISHAGRTAVAVVRELDDMDLSSGRGDAQLTTYFPIAGRGLTYGPGVQRGLAVVAIAGGVAVWFWIVARLVSRFGGRATITTMGWAVVVAIGALVAMMIVQSLLRGIRPEISPWYAGPALWWMAMIGAASLAVWAVSRWARSRAAGASLRTPASVWAAALPIWIVLAALAEWFVPAAAFLLTVPLATAVILIGASLALSRSLRLASATVFALAALLWVPDTHMLLSFVVPLFGWMSAPLPAAAFPALLALAGLMVVPPLRAALAGRLDAVARSRFAGGVMAGVTIAAIALAAVAPAYTFDRPLRRTLRYVQDTASQTAWWEVGGREPGTDVKARVPAGLDFQAATGALVDRRVPPLGLIYTYRATTAPVTDVPAAVTIVPSPDAKAGTSVRIRVVPLRQIHAVTIQVPASAAPSRLDVLAPLDVLSSAPRPTRGGQHSVAGRITGDWWSAVFVGVPDAGLEIELTFDAPASAVRGQIAVLLHTNDVPNAPGDLVPDWVSSDSTTWVTQSVFVVKP